MSSTEVSVPAQRRRAVWILALAAGILMSVATITPNPGYDYFWHLATGRWIVEHGAIPVYDPFSVTSDPEPWINGEWLFAVLLYSDWALTGHAGLSLQCALWVGALFALGFVAASRRADMAVAFATAVIAWYGGFRVLADRPATIGASFVALSVFLVTRPFTKRVAIAYPLLVIVWFNLHPSALLAPLILSIAAFGEVVAKGRAGIRQGALLIATGAASVLALFLNPYGAEALKAPFRLVRFIESGLITNVEWIHPEVSNFPLFYAVSAIVALALLLRRKPREDATAALLFALVFVLAFRYARNLAVFYAVLPIVAPPFFPAIRPQLHKIVIVASLALLALLAITEPHGLQIDKRVFPIESAEVLARSGAQGAILNDDQFGGYLIWKFYPQRRVLNDGRNELHKNYLAHLAEARRDSGAWDAMLRRFDVGAAVVDYSYPLIETSARATGEKRMVPKSLAFPRSEWGLIAFDDAAMVFVRRDHIAPAVLSRLEYRVLLPELPDPRFRRDAIPAAKRELERARMVGSGSVVPARIERGILLSERE